MIGPHGERLLGEATVTRRGAKEEHFLTRRAHAIADDVRKQPPEPRPAGEHVHVGGQRAAVGGAHSLARHGRLHRDLTIDAASREKSFEHGGTSAARWEVAAVPLEDGPAHALAVDLRIALRRLRARQLLEPSPGP